MIMKAAYNELKVAPMIVMARLVSGYGVSLS